MYFVILSTQRSGSIFLMKTMNMNPNVHSVGEVLKPDGGIYREEFSFYNNNRKIINKIPFINTWYFDRSVIRKLDDLESDAKGFKLMVGQDKYFFGLEYLLKYKGIRVIRLLRPNVLKQHVSRIRARTDKTWVANTKDYKKSLAKLNCITLISDLENLEGIQHEIFNKFSSCDSLMVSYPDLLDNFGSELRRIEDFLDVPRFDTYTNDRNLKIGGKSISDDVSNWKEVVSVLKGSKYEWMLDWKESQG